MRGHPGRVWRTCWLLGRATTSRRCAHTGSSATAISLDEVVASFRSSAHAVGCSVKGAYQRHAAGIPSTTVEAQLTQTRVVASGPSGSASALSMCWQSISPYCFKRASPSSPSSLDDATTEPITSSAFVVLPWDWHRAVREVADQLPYEGVAEPGLVQLLLPLCPPEVADQLAVAPARGAASRSVAAVLTGEPRSLAGWLHRHFAAHLLVSASATTGEAVYRCAGRDHRHLIEALGADGYAAAKLDHTLSAMHEVLGAMARVGRDRNTPQWIDTRVVAAAIPPHRQWPARSPEEWATLLHRPALRAAFDVKPLLQVRRARRPNQTRLLVDVAAVLSEMGGRGGLPDGEDALPSIVHRVCTTLDLTGGVEATRITLFRPPPKRGTPPTEASNMARQWTPTTTTSLLRTHVVEEVPVDAFLDAHHVIAAAVSGVAPVEQQQQQPINAADDDAGPTPNTALDVVVFCGEANKAVMLEALRTVRRSDLCIKLCTPTFQPETL